MCKKKQNHQTKNNVVKEKQSWLTMWLSCEWHYVVIMTSALMIDLPKIQRIRGPGKSAYA